MVHPDLSHFMNRGKIIVRGGLKYNNVYRTNVEFLPYNSKTSTILQVYCYKMKLQRELIAQKNGLKIYKYKKNII